MPVFPFLPIPSFSSISLPVSILPCPPPIFAFLPISNTFQNFRSSSELAVATVVPSGLIQECRILVWWAWGISTIFSSEGYDQRERWWSGTPWDERSSFAWGFQRSEVTWEEVTSELSRADWVVFQKWIVRSDEPPPEASNEEFQGHQARAWTSITVSLRQP